LPAEIAITPRSRSSADSARIRLNAPRGLNAPTRWNSSAFSQTGAPARSLSVAEEKLGVTCTRPSIARAAAMTSSSVGSAAIEAIGRW
jgi:hypothetical protein